MGEKLTEKTTFGEIAKGAARAVMAGVGYPLIAASAGFLTPQIVDALRDNGTTLIAGLIVTGFAHAWSAISKVGAQKREEEAKTM